MSINTPRVINDLDSLLNSQTGVVSFKQAIENSKHGQKMSRLNSDDRNGVNSMITDQSQDTTLLDSPRAFPNKNGRIGFRLPSTEYSPAVVDERDSNS